MSSLLSDLQLSAAHQALFCTDEDAMTKKSSGNDNKIKQDPKKPGAPELQDDELQQVSGGLAATRTAQPTDPVCISKL
jgi:bacteriocin-like protein